MRRLCLIALACLVAPAAGAQQRNVTVSSADCARLVRHEPAADVAYRPGADVHGRPVAPADLGGGTLIAGPDRFTIPITVDMAERLGIPPPGSGALHGGEITIGTVEVGLDGRAKFNGQPLQSDETGALAAACQRIAPRR